MSRSRNIKPGFFKNDILAECDPLARILFCGLWCEADREGRLHDRPNRIKIECLPYDDCDCDALLNQLASRGFIVRYEVNGINYIAIPEFLKHQNPHCKEQASSIPASEEHGASTVQARFKHDESTEVAGLIPDSLNLIPKSLEQQAARKTANRFAEFWSVYPVKKGKADAETKWKTKGYDAIADTIIDDVKKRIREDRQWLDGYAPHGSTYINARGWEDEIERRREPVQSMPDHMVGAL